MPKVAKGRRKRAYRPKTRTGCITCRRRRVKCDEAKPACLRCTSTSRTCDGYDFIQPQWTVTVAPNPSFDIHVYASPESRRSFAFFMQKTCPQQAGFFGSVFWEQLVFQAAYHEPSIRHAIVAIGSIHELIENRMAIKDVDKIFALEQYNIAIRQLLLPISRGGERGVDICLISCLLFTCFESIQGHHAIAGAHIRSGVKLLRQTLYDQQNGILHHPVLGSKGDGDCYVPLEVIARMFAVLDPEVNLMIGSYKFRLFERFFSSGTLDENPLLFNDIDEAKDMFEYGRGLFISSQVGQPDPLGQPQIEISMGLFESLMSKYTLALQEFIKSKGPFLTPKEETAMAVLQLHVLSSHILLYLERPPPDQKASWKDLMPQINEMLRLGEKIISGNDQGKSTFYCLDVGIVIPLYTLASKCTDPTIRRKAILLLRSTSRQEGLWNSHLVANALERIMEMEESALEEKEMDNCNDSLDQVTPLSIRPFFELDGKGGRLKYVKQGEDTNIQTEVVEKVFDWEEYHSSKSV